MWMYDRVRTRFHTSVGPAPAGSWSRSKVHSMDTHLVEVAATLTAEMVTNVVNHGRPPISIRHRRVTMKESSFPSPTAGRGFPRRVNGSPNR